MPLEVVFRPQPNRGIRSVGILAGGFNPPTRAHIALVAAAARSVDEVICVVPRIYPHKAFHGATLEERTEMLIEVASANSGPGFAVAIAEQGLFVEIAVECRQALGSDLDIQFICGRDAAERIVTWDYGAPGAIETMLENFGLLVAGRHGHWTPPDHIAHRVATLQLPESYDEVSSTEVRLRLTRGEAWQHLVPCEIVAQVAGIFDSRGPA